MADQQGGSQTFPGATGWTFSAAVRAVTGDDVDLRSLSAAAWFVFDPASVDRPDGTDEVGYQAQGIQFYGATIDHQAVGAFEAGVDALITVIADMSAGARGAMDISTLARLRDKVAELERFLDDTGRVFRRWGTDLDDPSSTFSGTAAKIVQVRMDKYAGLLELWSDRLPVDPGLPLSAAVEQARAGLDNVRVRMADAWQAELNGGLRGAIQAAIDAETSAIRDYLVSAGIVAGTPQYQLGKQDPTKQPNLVVTPAVIQDYQNATRAQILAVLAAYPKGDLRQAATWAGINQNVTGAVSAALDRLDQSAQQYMPPLQASYTTLSRGLKPLGTTTPPPAPPPGPGSGTPPPVTGPAPGSPPAAQPPAPPPPSGDAPAGPAPGGSAPQPSTADGGSGGGPQPDGSGTGPVTDLAGGAGPPPADGSVAVASAEEPSAGGAPAPDGAAPPADPAVPAADGAGTGDPLPVATAVPLAAPADAAPAEGVPTAAALDAPAAGGAGEAPAAPLVVGAPATRRDRTNGERRPLDFGDGSTLVPPDGGTPVVDGVVGAPVGHAGHAGDAGPTDRPTDRRVDLARGHTAHGGSPDRARALHLSGPHATELGLPGWGGRVAHDGTAGLTPAPAVSDVGAQSTYPGGVWPAGQYGPLQTQLAGSPPPVGRTSAAYAGGMGSIVSRGFSGSPRGGRLTGEVDAWGPVSTAAGGVFGPVDEHADDEAITSGHAGRGRRRDDEEETSRFVLGHVRDDEVDDEYEPLYESGFGLDETR